MNRKMLFLGGALFVLALESVGVQGQSLEFAVVSNSITAAVNLSAVANNGNVFVCVGSANSPVLSVNTNGFGAFASENGGGGYLLDSSAWTNTANSRIKNNWLNCVAAQPNGFVASGASNRVYVSSDGINWTNWGSALSAGNNSVAVDGISYNPAAGNFAAALATDEASWTTNPISTNIWRQATVNGASFAESFRAVGSFASKNMALCGILGDIRTSSDGGEVWNQSQVTSISYPTLTSVASDGGSNLVCAGDFSAIEVSTNGGPSGGWTFQSNINLGTTGTVTNFNAVAYSQAANGFLAAGALGADGLIVMAPITPGSTKWTWTRQTNLWSLKNGTLAPSTATLGQLNGAAIANSGFFQGIAMFVGDNGTVVIGGFPPPAPTNTYGNFITNILTSPEDNAFLGTNDASNIITDSNHPANILTMDWYSAPTGGIEVATNTFECKPPASLYSACGTFTNWAQERDLRTGLVSTKRTPFVFYILPGAPTDPVSSTNCDANGQFGMCALTPLSVTVVTNAANAPGSMEVDWYDGNSNLVAGGTFTPGSDIVTYTPVVTTPGIYTYYAQTTNPATGLASANWTSLTFQLNPLPQWTNSAEVYTNTLANPQTNEQLTVVPAVINMPEILSLSPGASIVVDWYTSPDPTVSTYENPQAPFAVGVASGVGTSGTLTPTNRLCGSYTYYARARVLDPGFTACACQSTNLVPVTLDLLPPPPVDGIVGLTNVLTGAVQLNRPVWVDLLTNSDNPASGFVVNWYSTQQGSNNPVLNYLNNGTETNLNNRFFHTPTNAVCGIFTNWAETMATHTGSGTPVVSGSRIPVVFAIIPATPTAIGVFNQTNCVEIPNPTFTVAVTNGQIADWYAVPPGAMPLASGTSYTPTNTAVGQWDFSAVAIDPGTGLSSTGAVDATLTLYDCSSPPTLTVNPNGTGTVQWLGNLTLLSATNLTPPVAWKSVATGSMFLAPNTLTWTNSNPPVQFFRLTN